MLPWLMALATVAVAIGIGSLLLSVDAAHEHQTASARMPKPLSLPRQRRGGMTPRGSWVLTRKRWLNPPACR